MKKIKINQNFEINKMSKEKWIYILKCQNDKWYVGRTDDLGNRLRQHFDGKGSEWTRLYKPIKMIEKIEGDNFDEDKYTLKYMDKYGIDNVRGASYVQIDLDENDKLSIQKRLRGVSDRCFECGGDHFVKDCHGKYKNKIYENKNEDDEENKIEIKEEKENEENENDEINDEEKKIIEINTNATIVNCLQNNIYTLQLEYIAKTYTLQTELQLSKNDKIKIKGTIQNDKINAINITFNNLEKKYTPMSFKVLSKINDTIYKVQGTKSGKVYIINNLGDMQKQSLIFFNIGSIIQGTGYISGIENNYLILYMSYPISLNGVTLDLGHKIKICGTIVSQHNGWYYIKSLETYDLVQMNKIYKTGDTFIGDFIRVGHHECGVFMYKENVIIPLKYQKEYYRYNKDGCCYNCGRNSHYANECYAKYDIHGRKL